MEQYNQDQLTGLELEFDSYVRQQFDDAAKWAKFISIVMFVISGLLLLTAIAGGSVLMRLFDRFGSYGSIFSMGGGIFMGILIFVALVLSATYYFLLNFANKIKVGLVSESIENVNAALNSLKTFFIITSVFGALSIITTLSSLF